MKKIFIVFTGSKNNQKKKYIISPNFECWDLKKFRLNDFVEDIKKEIPPVNVNVNNNYIKSETERKKDSNIGITNDEFKKCSWGLLLPDKAPGALVNSFAEILFLINLYSPHFLYPVFYVTDLGITKIIQNKNPIFYFHNQNQARLFKSIKFVRYFYKLLPQSVYGVWQRDRCQRWDKEDWRLFVASTLYSKLKDYDTGKNSITWQREAADMSTILECLFTAEDYTKEEIGYRLRKRIAALIGFRCKDIESDIKKLYKERNKFIHGAFFAEVGKDAKKEDKVTALPLPNFDLLSKHKNYVRIALLAYLNLAMAIKKSKIAWDKKGIKRTIDLLEEAIIDLSLRKEVEFETRQLFKLIKTNDQI